MSGCTAQACDHCSSIRLSGFEGTITSFSETQKALCSILLPLTTANNVKIHILVLNIQYYVCRNWSLYIFHVCYLPYLFSKYNACSCIIMYVCTGSLELSPLAWLSALSTTKKLLCYCTILISSALVLKVCVENVITA